MYFVNLTCNSAGSAVYGKNAMIHIRAKIMVIFMYNDAVWYGGAVCLIKGTIFVGAGSKNYVTFTYNSAYGGGAVWLTNGMLIVDSEASLRLSHNSASGGGGAVTLHNGELITNIDARLNFNNNSAIRKGGAVYLANSTVFVNANTIYFYNNTARTMEEPCTSFMDLCISTAINL